MLQSSESGSHISPQLLVDVIDKKLGLIGRLAIDSMINDHSCGGIRMMPNVTMHELIHLARNMTLKFGFWGIPMGGAKSCIFARENDSEEKKHRLLASFGRLLAPFLISEAYYPAEDMGTTAFDIKRILVSAGVCVYPNNSNNNQPNGGRDTSWTMLASAETAASHIGLDIPNSNIAIAGFGKIGAAAALTFSKSGAKVVAISTIKGAIHDPSGLDVDKLLKLRTQHGDNVINKYSARKMSKSKINKLKVDILMPCNGSWSINSSNLEDIKCKIICPGANNPFADKVEEALKKKHVLCIPDIVSNSGAAIAGYLAQYMPEQKIRSIISHEVNLRLKEIIDKANIRNVTFSRVAREIAMQKFVTTKRKAEQDIFLNSSFFKSCTKILPENVKRIIGRNYLKKLYLKFGYSE